MESLALAIRNVLVPEEVINRELSNCTISSGIIVVLASVMSEPLTIKRRTSTKKRQLLIQH